ncbi:MAG: hypothetical protein QG608_3687 [Actinomycetota bacterium]|nr:hypothetical protein [Actinomycetota bacterium]
MAEGSATAEAGEPIARYPLGADMAVAIESGNDPERGAGWLCSVLRADDEHSGGWRRVGEGDGASEALVDLLRHQASEPVEGFRVVRLVPPPQATGERAVETDRPTESVVVGERVVVQWYPWLADVGHPAPLSLSHLTAVRYLGVPITHGMLLWTSPSGHELPCAIATSYLPRAKDGWQWCVELVEQHLGLHVAPARSVPGPPPRGVDSWVVDWPQRLGRLIATLHLAMASPSPEIPQPVRWVGADQVHRWHTVALARLAQAEKIVRSGRLEEGETLFLPRVRDLRAALSGLVQLADEVRAQGRRIAVQRIHGDLHPGQILRWPGGLSITEFDGNTLLEDPGEDSAVQPAARDMAQLLRNIDHVGRIVNRRSGGHMTAAVDAWSRSVRRQILNSYRAELVSANRGELFDELLLAPFEAEQVCRELIYSDRCLPEWAYAPLAGLRLMYPKGHPGSRNRP